MNGETSQQVLPVPASKTADESKIRDESSESTENQAEAPASSLESGVESQLATKGGMDKLYGDFRVRRLGFVSVLQKACSGC